MSSAFGSNLPSAFPLESSARENEEDSEGVALWAETHSAGYSNAGKGNHSNHI